MNNPKNLKILNELNVKVRIQVVSGVVHPEVGESNILYLVKPSGSTIYEQWVCEVSGTSEVPVYTWTQVGTIVDLSPYLTSSDAALTYRTIADSYTKSEVDSKVAGIYKVKGSATVSQINALSGMVQGDVYNMTDSGTITNTGYTSFTVSADDNIVWTDSKGWDKLSSTVDLSNYATKSEVTSAVSPKLDSTTAASTYRTIADSYTKSEVDAALNNKLDSTTAASTYRTITAAEEAELVTARALSYHDSLIAQSMKNGDASITLHDTTGDVTITAQQLREVLSLIAKNS